MSCPLSFESFEIIFITQKKKTINEFPLVYYPGTLACCRWKQKDI